MLSPAPRTLPRRSASGVSRAMAGGIWMRRALQRARRRLRATPPIEQQLARLDATCRDRLLSMYGGHAQLGVDGVEHALDASTRISPDEGLCLYDLYVAARPANSLEVGMAFGFSTLYFLAAIAANGRGKHVAIDPYQNDAWRGIGQTQARAAAHDLGRADAFALIEERSDRAAVDLLRSGARFDFIFIDGNHRFDDVLVDVYFYAQLCALGGLLIFDDLWMPSVRSVARFVRRNRLDFVEVPVDEPNLCVWRKVGEDARRWDDFRRFLVG